MATPLKMYQVDAFTEILFSGNPAAVFKLSHFLPDELMQSIALENNLSETAFVVPRDDREHYDLRWFTPTHEIDFCGHATIATAHTLMCEYGRRAPFHFHTKIGELVVSESQGWYHMEAPVTKLAPTMITHDMRTAFPGAIIKDAFFGGDNLYLVLEKPEQVRNAMADMNSIRPLSDEGVVITARCGEDYDFISRYFAPLFGIDEDPVTGSTHAALGPYWSQQLGRSDLYAYQASKRGGELRLAMGETRLIISGQAITFLQADIRLPI